MFIGADVTNDTPSAWLGGKAAELVEESRNAAVSDRASCWPLAGSKGEDDGT
jgi:hypothetical protein